MTDSHDPAGADLATSDAVLEALGGINAVVDQLVAAGMPASRGGRRSTYARVGNWKYKNRFPASTYPFFKSALQARGLTAPPSLWGVLEMEGAQQ